MGKYIRALSITALMLISLATLPAAYCKGGDGDPEMEFGRTYEGWMFPMDERNFWNLYVAEPGTVTIEMDVQPGIQGSIYLFGPGFPSTDPFPREAYGSYGDDVILTTYISEPGWCDITLEYLNIDYDIIDRESQYLYTIKATFSP
jgi:hypothetical protein